MSGILRRLTAAALAAAALAVILPGVLALRVDNSPERFFARDDESLQSLAELRDLFGGERRVLLVVTFPDLWSEAGLAAIADVERAAGRSAAVVRTSGLWSRYRWLEPVWPPRDVEAFEERARRDPLCRAAGWLGESADVATIDVEMLESIGAADVSALEARVRAAAPSGMVIDLIGLPVIERAMAENIRRVLEVQFPALLVAAMLLLWIGFRSLAETAAPLLLVAIVELTTLGLVGWSGARLDLVSVVVLPLLLVISLATAVHLQIGFRHELEAGLAAGDACRETMRRKGRAVILTSVTTAIAFASFASSPLAPLRALGAWVAGGLLILMLAAFAVYPALLRMTAARAGSLTAWSLERAIRRRSDHLAGWLERRRIPVLVVFVAAVLFAAAGLSRLEIESSLLSYVAPDHPLGRSARLLQSEGLGSGAVELLIRLPEDALIDERFRDPLGLERLASTAEALRRVEGVRGAVGAGDLFRAAVADIVVSGEASPGARWLVLGIMQADAEVAARLDSVLADEGRAARITLLLPLRGPQDLDPVFAVAVRIAQQEFPGAEVSLTGELPLILTSQRRLLETMATSFALTVGAIALLLALVIRSPAGLVRFLAPNLWAVLAVFGGMGWLGVPLDSTTVMIAAVALGLAVDDTLHTMAESDALSDSPADRYLPRLLQRVTSAHTLTALVLVAGFSTVALSDFVPVARFGALAALGVVAALAGDLLLLPALLLRRGRDAERGEGGEKAGRRL